MTDDTRTDFESELPGRADVVVIGAGIAGASVAHHLAKAGVDVLLIERGRVGGGATAAAVGVLSPPLRQPFDQTVHFRGEDTARAIWDFALRSVRGLGETLVESGSAEDAGLDLSGGYVLAEAYSQHEVENSHRSLEKAGMPVEWLTRDEVHDLIGGRGFTGGYRIDGGGSINPGPTAIALARSAAQHGARVVEGVSVSASRREPTGIVLETDQGEMSAEIVVYATHVDSRRFSSFLGDEIVPIRGQAMITTPGAKGFSGSFSTHWKMNVWRWSTDSRLVLGGWRHDAWDRSYWKTRPELDDSLQADVQKWFESSFPESAPLDVEHRWSGIFGWTADYLPLVGAVPGRTGEMVISGFSGGGLPFAYEAGRVIASAVTEGEPVPGGDLLNPRRFT